MTVSYLPESGPEAVDPADGSDATTLGPREALARYAELGGFTLSAETSPWYAATETITTPEDARSASTLLAELRGGDLAATRAAVLDLAPEGTFAEPDTLLALGLIAKVLLRVQGTTGKLRSEAYEADLETLAAATADSRWRKERGVRLSWLRRRSLVAQARSLALTKGVKRAELHEALSSAATERSAWTTLGGTVRPAAPTDPARLTEVAQAVDALTQAARALEGLLPGHALETLPLADLTDLVDRLAADEGTLYRLPTLRTLRTTLTTHHLTPLLEDLTTRQATRDLALTTYDREHPTLVPEPRAAEPAAVAEPAEPVEPAAEAPEVADETAAPAAEVAAPAEEAVELVAEAPEAPETPEASEAPAEGVEPAVAAEELTEPTDEVSAEPAEPTDEAVTDAPAEPTAEIAAEMEAVAVAAAELARELAAEPVAVTELSTEELQAEAEVEAEVQPIAEAEPVAEPEVEAVAEVEADPVAAVEPDAAAAVDAESELEPTAEAVSAAAEADAEAAAEPTDEPETEQVAAVELEADAAPVETVESAAAPEAAVEPGAAAELSAEPEPADADADADADAESEVEPAVAAEELTELEPAPEAAPAEAELPAQDEPEATVEAEPSAEELAEPEAAPVEEPAAAADSSNRPAKPDLTPGRPVTAYSADELTALVRWIDSDEITRTDDELLRAAMKELGFSRLGPRIKEALGTAVTTARS
ncbi:hypothetical protein CFP65_6059 [Kitasatospora sp. MMS16-BH015]|uniref:hypothetical protein n=1 Tax=Kitasatospora sp. MMS16-BH015 TaxID=2018025 RepID=UPI000CA14A8F|nr:hypothetical protein [Kitasatospora sp. MMS16-BH015]AUG80730.1 hypothetical protein CFP65_6059 [Kitasatospora sp. MMS16-BH015]